MRISRDVWLKTVRGLAVALAATLTSTASVALTSTAASAQEFGPLAFLADADESVPAGDAERDDTDYWIGVRCVELPDVLRAQLDLAEGQGVLIDDVVADSPAKRAGLKTHDVIAAVDGKPMNDPRSLAEAVSGAGGRELKIEYLRAGHKQSLTVKPAPRPESVAPRPQRQDQRALREWVERLGRGPAPMRFRFWHPGMILPPGHSFGASLMPALPDDMTVTIEKQGGKPAKVTVKQGDKQWQASRDSLDKLPDEARVYVERLLAWSEGGLPPGHPGPPPHAMPPEHAAREEHFHHRLDEMSRQLDDLRRAVEKLHGRSGTQ